MQIAQSNPDFSTLVQAVTAAGLAETLSGPGPFTVFAPTNAAFAALPAGTLDTLLKDPTGQLASILKLHVVSGAVDSAAAKSAAGGTVETLGGPVAVTESNGTLMVGGATVTTADIKASNGVIHVIDAVITKPATSDEASMPAGVNAGTAGLAAGSGAGTATWLVLALLGGIASAGRRHLGRGDRPGPAAGLTPMTPRRARALLAASFALAMGVGLAWWLLAGRDGRVDLVGPAVTTSTTTTSVPASAPPSTTALPAALRPPGAAPLPQPGVPVRLRIADLGVDAPAVPVARLTGRPDGDPGCERGRLVLARAPAG